MALVVTNHFPMEYGAARMLQELNPETVHVFVNMQEIKDTQKIEAAIKAYVPKKHSPIILFFGTYWKEAFGTFAQLAGKNAKIWVFAPSQPTVSLTDLCTPNFIIDYDPNRVIGPLQWAFKIYSSNRDLLPKHPSAATWFETLNKSIFKIMDNRYYDQDSVTTQPWWTGFINTDTEVSKDERWKRLYQGKYEQAKLIEKGTGILESQRALCKERVEKNSRVIDYKLDAESTIKMRVVSDHGTLLTITHDIVTELGKEQVSAVIYTLLKKDKEAKRKAIESQTKAESAEDSGTQQKVDPSKEESDELEDIFGVSLRAIDSTVDVREIARKYYGDGTSSRAGANISFKKLKQDF